MGLDLACFPNEMAAYSLSLYDIFHKECESSIVYFNDVDEGKKNYNGLKEI